jgi:hypothetical protein
MKTRLTERDLTRIVKRVINEQTDLQPLPDYLNSFNVTADDFNDLGGVNKINNVEIQFEALDGRTWVVTKEWVWQEKGVDDQPSFLSPSGNGSFSGEFIKAFNNRKQ